MEDVTDSLYNLFFSTSISSKVVRQIIGRDFDSIPSFITLAPGNTVNGTVIVSMSPELVIEVAEMLQDRTTTIYEKSLITLGEPDRPSLTIEGVGIVYMADV